MENRSNASSVSLNWLYELEKSISCSIFLPGSTCSVLCHVCSEVRSEATTDTCVLLIVALVQSAAVPATLWDFLLDTCGEHLPHSFLTVHTLKKGKGCLWFLAGNRPNMVPVASALRGEAIQTSSRSSTQPYFIVFCCKTCDEVNGRDWQ